jgi:hypothetical protein
MNALVAALVVLGCVNATQETLDESVRNLKIAEGALNVDDFEKTRKWLEPVVEYVNTAKSLTDPKDGKVHLPGGGIGVAPDPGFVRRVYRVRALLRSRDPKSTQATRDEGMAMFEKEALGSAPDPTVLADYAEIMSRVPARTGQATMMLRSLDAKDIMGSAHAYAALAALEKQAGNATAEAAARAKCKTRTTVQAICG